MGQVEGRTPTPASFPLAVFTKGKSVMNSKERIIRTLRGQAADGVPVAPHWWGVYKLELAGLGTTFEETDALALQGEALAQVDMQFFERFRPDWFHLGVGGGGLRLPSRLRSAEFQAACVRLRQCRSRAEMDDYLSFVRLTEAEIQASGAYAHVPLIVERYGGEVFIALNEPDPVSDLLDPHGDLGFERGLIALAEHPAFVRELLYRLYEIKLDWMRTLAATGCHGYIGSATFVSADIISPKMYREIVFPAQEMFYAEVRKLGMEPILYFLGDINPLIPQINRLDISALLVEESKKAFTLDVVKIRQQLRSDITLFGNVDSVYPLLHGNRNQVVEETRQQKQAAAWGPFVVANGSPLAFGTPPENVEAMIHTARAGG
jgi:uroporphyrinogen-III decarboxylase